MGQLSAKRTIASIIFLAISITGMAAFLKFDWPPKPQSHDIFHYVIGGKYFESLGYDGIYDATALSLHEQGLIENDLIVRNLKKKIIFKSESEWLNDGTEIKRKMGNEQWALFSEDVAYFEDINKKNPNWWHTVFHDHGFNPSPTWLLYGKPLLSNFSLKSIYQWLPYLDLFLLLSLSAGLAISLPSHRAAFFAIFWLFIGFFPGETLKFPAWVGGSYFRFSWLFFLTFGIIFLERKNWGSAGFLLMIAAMERIFPVFFWGAAGMLILTRALKPENRNWNPLLRFSAGSAISAVILIGSALFTSGNSFEKFISNTREHNATYYSNGIGLRSLATYSTELLTYRQWKLNVPDLDSEEIKNAITGEVESPDSYKTAMSSALNIRFLHNYPALIAGIIILLTSVISLIRKQSLFSALLAATSFLFITSNASHYYYTFLILLLWAQAKSVLASKETTERRQFLLIAAFFTAVILACSLTHSIKFASILFSALLFLWIGFSISVQLTKTMSATLASLVSLLFCVLIYFSSARLAAPEILPVKHHKQFFNASAIQALKNADATQMLNTSFMDVYSNNIVEKGTLLYEGESIVIDLPLEHSPTTDPQLVIRSDFGYPVETSVTINSNEPISNHWETVSGLYAYGVIKLPANQLHGDHNTVELKVEKGAAMALYHIWVVE